jgi:HEPN domain-containing protein
MPPDPVRVDETRAWLVGAARDLRAGDHDLSADPPLTGDIVFHAQQAAEKSLKGFLTWHDEPFRKTHDLAELGRPCLARDPALEPLLRRADGLTVYAWAFRYPGDLEEPPVGEAEEALALGREVLAAILDRLPVETHP